ncbi:hypothetical protein KZZ52_19310 [Dactylosporangium sp. AC04546]|uniref:hypothetical protein n=1 Tax=Dactylosporangium sp. AC04546 TaxID=2862460 RepID=UPI002E7B2F62|nr:hypothetical protein [Dactylosporangium sp. AC04546]WVK87451.1 hypothetical protein KZZ52_19310 [Dactylosporangium sp. AC04546]
MEIDDYADSWTPRGRAWRFALELRQLREAAGRRALRRVSAAGGPSIASLSAAEKGADLPTWKTTAGYLKGCDVAEGSREHRRIKILWHRADEALRPLRPDLDACATGPALFEALLATVAAAGQTPDRLSARIATARPPFTIKLLGAAPPPPEAVREALTAGWPRLTEHVLAWLLLACGADGGVIRHWSRHHLRLTRAAGVAPPPAADEAALPEGRPEDAHIEGRPVMHAGRVAVPDGWPGAPGPDRRGASADRVGVQDGRPGALRPDRRGAPADRAGVQDGRPGGALRPDRRGAPAGRVGLQGGRPGALQPDRRGAPAGLVRVPDGRPGVPGEPVGPGGDSIGPGAGRLVRPGRRVTGLGGVTAVLAVLAAVAVLLAADGVPGDGSPSAADAGLPARSTGPSAEPSAQTVDPAVAGVSAAAALDAIRRRVAGSGEQAAAGRYTFTHIEVWSPSGPPGGPMEVSDERLYWDAERHGVRRVTRTGPGGRTVSEPDEWYDGGARVLFLGVEQPSADPGTLDRQLREQQPGLGTSGVLRAVADLCAVRHLDREHRLAVLAAVARLPGLTLLGVRSDRAAGDGSDQAGGASGSAGVSGGAGGGGARTGRPGIAVAADLTADGMTIRDVLLFDEATGALLSAAQLLVTAPPGGGVRLPAELRYTLYLDAGRTDVIG